MTLLEQNEVDEISAQIRKLLSGTRYACSSLTRINRGSVNFLFRGVLAHPLAIQDGPPPDVASTIIVKHSKEFLSCNRNFPLEVSRSSSEEMVLDALQNSFKFGATATPRLYLHDRESNTQVLQDFPESVDLESIFSTAGGDARLSETVAASIGRQLGAWLRAFHNWAATPGQAAFRAGLGDNEPMRRLKYATTYDSFIKILENFPDLLEGKLECLEALKASAAADFQKHGREEAGGDWGIIHGDFGTGNILAPSNLLDDPRGEEDKELVVIDWEFCQFGHRAYDLGTMVGDLYQRKIFNGLDVAFSTIRGFIDGYGGLGDDMAFRVAIHAGVHLLHWYNRGGPPATRGTPAQIREAMTAGRDFVVRGWGKDRAWFESSALASLFVKK